MAAGTEPFRLANYSFHRTRQTVQAMYMDTVEPSLMQPQARKCCSILQQIFKEGFHVIILSEQHR